VGFSTRVWIHLTVQGKIKLLQILLETVIEQGREGGGFALEEGGERKKKERKGFHLHRSEMKLHRTDRGKCWLAEVREEEEQPPSEKKKKRGGRQKTKKRNSAERIMFSQRKCSNTLESFGERRDKGGDTKKKKTRKEVRLGKGG